MPNAPNDANQGFDPMQVAAAGASAYNTYQTSQNNKANIDFAQGLYSTSRKNALYDLEQYNLYNSPLQQMNRLREAGLNPHLIYGNGAQFATQMARDSNTSAPRSERNQVDPNLHSQSILQSQSLKAMQAQTDNLAVQRQLLEEQVKNTKVNSLKQASETAQGNYNLEQNKLLQPTLIARQIADLDKTRQETNKMGVEMDKYRTDIQFTKDENRRKEELQSGHIDIQAKELEKLGYDTETAHMLTEISKVDRKTKEMDLMLKRYGIDSHSSSFLNDLNKLLNSSSEGANITKKLREIYNRKY